MHKFIPMAAAAICLTLSGAAMAAAAGAAEARLQTPVAAPKQVVIDGRVWSCAGDTCTAGTSNRNQPVSRECARVAKELGALTGYRSGDRVLDADQLKSCNG